MDSGRETDVGFKSGKAGACGWDLHQVVRPVDAENHKSVDVEGTQGISPAAPSDPINAHCEVLMVERRVPSPPAGLQISARARVKPRLPILPALIRSRLLEGRLPRRLQCHRTTTLIEVWFMTPHHTYRSVVCGTAPHFRKCGSPMTTTLL